MMASLSLGLLFAHWLVFLDAIQQFFWRYTPRPLLTTFFLGLIEDGSEFSSAIHLPQIHDLPDYIHSIDATTICLAPTNFSTLSTLNVTCGVDRPGNGLDDVPLIMAESSHYCVFLDTPVRRSAQVPYKDAHPDSLLAQAEDDDARTNMDSYGARELSFCPVLVGIKYIHSLLHLYMLLMIPSLFNHWFEDALVYDSLNPKDLLDFSWFLYTSFWIAPWHLFRYGTRKTLACLCRHRRSVARKSAHLPVPRIVLVRIDGEAVPINFSASDLQASLEVGVSSPLELANLVVDHRASVFEDSESLDLVPYRNSGNAEECDLSSMPTIPPRSEHQDGLANVQNGIRHELFTSEFSEGSQTLKNEIPDQWTKCYPLLVEAENESPQSIDLIVATSFVVTTSNSGGIQEGPGNSQHTPSLEVANNVMFQDAKDDSGDDEVQDQDPTLRPQIVGDDRDVYRSDAPDSPDSTTTASPSTRSQDNVPKHALFFVYDDIDLAHDRQLSLGASHADEHKALGSQLCHDDDDHGARTKQVLVDPFGTSVNQTPLDHVTHTVLGEEVAENVDMFTRCLTPPSPKQPVVNLPSLIATREDIQLIGIDLIFPSVLMEEVVARTRSPLQIHCPTMPVVVINMTNDIEDVEESLTPSGTKAPNQVMSGQTGTPNSMAAACERLNINFCGYSSTFPPSPSIEGLRSVCSSNVKDCTGSSQNDVRGPGTSVQEAAGLATVLELKNDPKTEDQAGNYNGTNTSLSSRTVSCSFAEATEWLTTKPSEDTYNEANHFPTTLEVKKTDESDDGKNSESNTTPQNYLNLILKPPPERTLSGSMHAPSESLPNPQPKKDIDQPTIPHEASLSSTCPVQVAKVGDDEAVMNVMAENQSEREHDLFASIHAPTKVTKVEVRSSIFQSTDQNHCDHRRSVTTPVVASEEKHKIKPCGPNWTAMPDVVDAFRVFREAPGSGNSVRRASSVAECANRTPTVGVVGQKGVATSSLNNTCVTANIQSHWMSGSGLLLVRDLVPSNPADFNLRTCTSTRIVGSHGMNTTPMQRVLHPGVLDVSPHAVHRSTVATAVQRQQSMSAPCVAELEHILGSQRWTAYRR